MSNSGRMDCTSKRFVFVTLKTSHRSWKLCFSDHGMCHRLDKPMSTLKKPSPRTWLRAPDSPGNGLVNELMAAVPFAKTLTTALPLESVVLNLPEFTGEVKNALPPSCQFVGH